MPTLLADCEPARQRPYEGPMHEARVPPRLELLANGGPQENNVAHCSVTVHAPAEGMHVSVRLQTHRCQIRTVTAI